MKVTAQKTALPTIKTDALCVAMFKKDKLPKSLQSIDKSLNGELTQILKNKDFTGDKDQIKVLNTHRKVKAKNIVLVGLGDKKDFTRDKLRRTAGNLSKKMRTEGFTDLATDLALAEIKDITIDEKAQAVAEGLILSLYKFDKYKSKPKNNNDKKAELKNATLLIDTDKNLAKAKKAVTKATKLTANVNYIRDLVNDQADTVTPTYLANQAKKIGRASKGKISVKVFGKKEITKMKMGGLLGVAKGSHEEPKFIVMDYKGSPSATADPIVLVGKGITFDSGGLNTKPAPSMMGMQADMTGAATVIATVKALCELGVKRRVVAIVPTCENMNNGKAFKLGDILTAYNGKTMEIHHTDAEGRLILADALSYADKNYKAKCIIDIATLTGASIIALGYEITSLVSTDDKLKERIFKSVERTDELTWELPVIDDYKELVKSDIADVRNTGKGGMGPGTITAGIFLSNFVDKAPWAHFDIGATSWLDYDHPYKPKGATGVCLRTFVDIIENY